MHIFYIIFSKSNFSERNFLNFLVDITIFFVKKSVLEEAIPIGQIGQVNARKDS